ADATMADHLYELSRVSFVTNSDAHSLGKIGREYNALLLHRPSFRELELALRRLEGRRIAAKYGLNPKLGQYYRPRCIGCGDMLSSGLHRLGGQSGCEIGGAFCRAPLGRRAGGEGRFGPDRRKRRRAFQVPSTPGSLAVAGPPGLYPRAGTEDPGPFAGAVRD